MRYPGPMAYRQADGRVLCARCQAALWYRRAYERAYDVVAITRTGDWMTDELDVAQVLTCDRCDATIDSICIPDG